MNTPNPRFRKVFLAPLAATLALTASLALQATPARAWFENDTWADGRLVDVQVRVDGEAAALFPSPNGDDRHYLQAFAGRNYSIVLRNNTPRRIGVLLAVDGLNVVNGEVTRLAAGEPMYVLDPYESATIAGWRTSLDEVRRFVFVDERRSYAERTGQANSDMGWIRVQAYREQVLYSMWNDVRRGGRSDLPTRRRINEPTLDAPAPDAGAPPTPERAQAGREESAPQATNAPQGQLDELKALNGTAKDKAGSSFPGTGWGDRHRDPVREIEFHAERIATDRIVFRYEYASGLRALGIFPAHDRDRLRERDGGQVGFAQPPRW